MENRNKDRRPRPIGPRYAGSGGDIICLEEGGVLRSRPGGGGRGPDGRRGSRDAGGARGLPEVEGEVVGRRGAAGDERALGGLYDRYAGLIYGAGTRYLGDRGQAEDLVQDVFLSVWRNAGSFDPSRARD